MALARFAALTLLRFEDLTEYQTLEEETDRDLLFANVGADFRASGMDVRSKLAHKHLIWSLHSSLPSAKAFTEKYHQHVPWGNPCETWSAVLQPFRHIGEINHLDPKEPSRIYEIDMDPPDPSTPVLIVTSVGWSSFEPDDIERIKDFGGRVAAVRIGMTGIPGLISQQSFSLDGGLAWDGLTVTMWDKLATAMNFAYGPGYHCSQVKMQRETSLGDRTSFTRFVVLESHGTWHGQVFP